MHAFVYHTHILPYFMLWFFFPMTKAAFVNLCVWFWLCTKTVVILVLRWGFPLGSSYLTLLFKPWDSQPQVLQTQNYVSSWVTLRPVEYVSGQNIQKKHIWVTASEYQWLKSSFHVQYSKLAKQQRWCTPLCIDLKYIQQQQLKVGLGLYNFLWSCSDLEQFSVKSVKRVQNVPTKCTGVWLRSKWRQSWKDGFGLIMMKMLLSCLCSPSLNNQVVERIVS